MIKESDRALLYSAPDLLQTMTLYVYRYWVHLSII